MRRKLKQFKETVSGFETAFGLELLATVHWVINKENRNTLDEVISGVYSWNTKKQKFSKKQIETAYDTLKAQAWV